MVQFARPRMDQLFQRAAFLLHARDRQLRPLERIEHAQQVLPLPEYDLRRALHRAYFLLFVLHQVGTSHDSPRKGALSSARRLR